MQLVHRLAEQDRHESPWTNLLLEWYLGFLLKGSSTDPRRVYQLHTMIIGRNLQNKWI